VADFNRVLRIEKGKAEVVRRPMPVPASGFVLVRQHIAPICIEHRAYETGFAEWFEDTERYGHEGVGEISAIGPGVTEYSEGDRVVIFQGWACGHCWVCEHGLGATHCINLKGPREIEEHNGAESGGGGYCEYRLVPANMMAKIPDGLSYKHASAANCLIGCTYSSMRDHNISPEHYCLIAGVGFIGHATITNLKYRGAKVIVLGRTPSRMKMAEDLGADLIVNPEDSDWLEQVRSFTPDGRGPDFAFECSGYPYYQQRCLDALRHYGTLILLGYAAHEGRELKWDLNTEHGLCWGHKTITAHFDVNFGHRQDLMEVLSDPWMQQRIDKMVSHQIPMSRAAEAFERIIAKKACKVHLLPQE
jgi:threonine dehydrogenase-like Zn-dependent dehydrogenase